MSRWHIILKKLKPWQWWAIGLTSPVWVLILFGLMQAAINFTFFHQPLFDTLSLDGRKVIVDRGDLVLIEYGAGNSMKETVIPNSKEHGIEIPENKKIREGVYSGEQVLRWTKASTGILADGSVIWNRVSTTTSSYEIWKYTNGTTTKIVSIPLLNLADYAIKYEKGAADPLSAIQHMTGYAYEGPFIIFSTTTFGFLEVMPIEGDGSKISKLALIRRVYDFDGNLVEREREGEIVDYILFDLSRERTCQYFNRYHLKDTDIWAISEGCGKYQINNTPPPIFKSDPLPETRPEAVTQPHVESVRELKFGYCIPVIPVGGCEEQGYTYNRVVRLDGTSTTTLYNGDYINFLSHPHRANIDIGIFSQDKKLLVVRQRKYSFDTLGTYFVPTNPYPFFWQSAKAPDDEILYIK